MFVISMHKKIYFNFDDSMIGNRIPRWRVGPGPLGLYSQSSRVRLPGPSPSCLSFFRATDHNLSGSYSLEELE